MSETAADRPYDIVLFGATGFVGRLTAEYLARHAPADCRWAIAGRNEIKLAAVRKALAAINPALADLPLLSADSSDPRSLRALADNARVVISTVGPYVLYGDGLVAACAAAGTDYLDLTGEPEFVDTCFVRHHRTAQRTGARLVHAAGFDSLPHDLGALFTVLQLPADVPVQMSGYVRIAATFSGGTFYSALTAFSRPRQNIAAARARRAAESPGDGRSVHAGPGRPGRNPTNGGWALPFPSIDPQIVGRSARALPRYGPQFRYAHHLVMPRLINAVGGALGAAAVVTAAQVPPVRRALLSRLRPGEGPTAARRAASWFTVTFVAQGGDERVVTRVSGGDPGYDETARMLSESALCLAFDELAATAGQVTTAQAMGEKLIERLRTAGIDFEVLESAAH